MSGDGADFVDKKEEEKKQDDGDDDYTDDQDQNPTDDKADAKADDKAAAKADNDVPTFSKQKTLAPSKKPDNKKDADIDPDLKDADNEIADLPKD